MSNRHLIICGTARSGTTNLYAYFNSILKKHYYRRVDPCSENAVQELRNLVTDNEPFFDVNWAWYHKIMEIEQSIPTMRFMITLRNPEDVINSLKRKKYDKHIKYHKGKMTQEQFYSTRPDETFIDHWFRIYRSIVKQVTLMKHKPFLILFDKYINNEYNELFSKIFDIEFNPKRKLNSLRINSSKHIEIETIQLNTEQLTEANELIAKVKKVCEDNWIKMELQ